MSMQHTYTLDSQNVFRILRCKTIIHAKLLPEIPSHYNQGMAKGSFPLAFWIRQKGFIIKVWPPIAKQRMFATVVFVLMLLFLGPHHSSCNYLICWISSTNGDLIPMYNHSQLQYVQDRESFTA